VKLVELVSGEGDMPVEQPSPKQLSDSTITVLYV
jgi:hypothetical protein